MLPELTHLQFAVLSILTGSKLSGRSIREQLAKAGVRKSLAAFYQLMARLEDGGMVTGWYEQVVVDGVTIKERNYEIRAHGMRCLDQTRDFYTAKEPQNVRLVME